MDVPPPTSTKIPFSHTPTQLPLRLLSLPPSLLSLLTTPSSSPAPTLLLKSAAPPSTIHPSDQTYNAVLCTPTETYTLRQVYSSNSIFLVRPDACAGVTAIATAAATLELLPAPADAARTRAQLKSRLPAWTGCDHDDFHERDAQRVARARLLADTPVSAAEFGAAWDALWAFERFERAWVPRATVVEDALRQMVAAGAAAEKFWLVDIVDAVCDDADGGDAGVTPEGLVRALVRDTCVWSPDERWAVVPRRWARVAARAVLEAYEDVRKAGGIGEWGVHSGTKDFMYISFMTKWKEAVPEGCRSVCKLELIKDFYMLPTPSTIRYVENPNFTTDVPTDITDITNGAAATPSTSAPTPAAASKPTGALPIRNKWHEKFRKDKK
ncbi:sister chromatid cohesion protein Dcc1 [Geopyxis carbonaria]|nr:sister chromatid cohesion protein Dcc1 [Geopyxis carbonaria]